jgi:hypothetical protein
MELILYTIASVLLAVSYRGKGGGWSNWNVLPDGASSLLSHGLSAILAGIAMGLATHSITASVLAVPAFFLFTKPDIGPGFAIFSADTSKFLHEITGDRGSATENWLFYPADKGAFVLYHKAGVRIAAFYWMTLRLAVFALPYAAIAYLFGVGSAWGFLGLFSLSLAYVAGGVAFKLLKYDPVEASEVLMGTPLALLIFTLASTIPIMLPSFFR